MARSMRAALHWSWLEKDCAKVWRSISFDIAWRTRTSMNGLPLPPKKTPGGVAP